MNDLKKRNLTMLTDFYEITMANGYFLNGKGDTTAQFDIVRKNISKCAVVSPLPLRK